MPSDISTDSRKTILSTGRSYCEVLVFTVILLHAHPCCSSLRTLVIRPRGQEDLGTLSSTTSTMWYPTFWACAVFPFCIPRQSDLSGLSKSPWIGDSRYWISPEVAFPGAQSQMERGLLGGDWHCRKNTSFHCFAQQTSLRAPSKLLCHCLAITNSSAVCFLLTKHRLTERLQPFTQFHNWTN